MPPLTKSFEIHQFATLGEEGAFRDIVSGETRVRASRRHKARDKRRRPPPNTLLHSRVLSPVELCLGSRFETSGELTRGSAGEAIDQILQQQGHFIFFGGARSDGDRFRGK